jgi:hypothetical protein
MSECAMTAVPAPVVEQAASLTTIQERGIGIRAMHHILL